MESPDAVQRLQESRRAFLTYPCNQIRTEQFQHELEQYRTTLDGNGKYFAPTGGKPNIHFWTLLDPSAGEDYQPKHRVGDEELSRLLSDSRPDPVSEFIFISSRTSRSPLGCSKEQLKQILTHREVMAPFLDFVFKFRQRGEPETLTSFRIEDWLYHTNVSFADQSLRRSGFRIQHCFNLIAVELGENQDWTLRQNATYHSFDPVNGQAFWLNLKGNDEVSKRLKKSIPAHPLLRPSALTSPEARFMATLVTHLIIIQWCVENWPKYVDDLQKALREQLDKVRLGPVTHLTEPENIEKVAAFRRGNTMNSAIGMPPPSRKSTLQKRTSFKAPELVKRLSGRIFKDSSKARSPSPEKHKEDDIDLDFDDLYSFKELQNLGQLGDTMQQSVLVLGQNINIIDDLVARYEGLMNSSEFKQHVKTTECQFGMNTFRSRSQQHIRSMESCVLRLNNIIGTLESAMDQFHGILQYRNIKTSEYFAQSAHDSTKVMEHMAIKTKQETVSMHSITILTLVFLPGTFLAITLVTWLTLTRLGYMQTVFGSGLLRWNEEGGDWAARVPGLRLFLAICLPLTGLTLGLWLFWNWWSKKKQKEDFWRLKLAEEGGLVPAVDEKGSEPNVSTVRGA